MKVTLLGILLLLTCGEVNEVAALEPAASGVVINNRPVTREQLQALEARLQTRVPAGRYWYDKRSGLGGPWGTYASVFVPGLDFGPVPADASGGDTGIFYNGRQLSRPEARLVAALLGVPEAAIPQYRGRYTLDQNGAVFTEAGQFLVNLTLAAAAAGWGAGGGGNGGCTAVRIPSSAPNPTGVPQTIDVATGTNC
jgi:hypothetical protein